MAVAPGDKPLDSHTDRARAESFGTVAQNYDLFRPTYPAELIDDLLSTAPAEVVDVGCGTGKAATLLAARGCEVLGVEIDEKMAEVARTHGISVEVASFEGWDDGGRQFDLLTCGQAWHWVDPGVGVAKAAQVLRPGGYAGLFWNRDVAAEPARAAIDAAYAEHAPELREDWVHAPDQFADRPHAQPFEQSALFSSVATKVYAWQRTFTPEEWIGMCLTTSAHLLLPAARRAALVEAMRRNLDPIGEFVADYATYLIHARRA